VEVFAVGVSNAAAARVDTLEWMTNDTIDNILLITDTQALASLPGVTSITNISSCSA
jgi:hypothetical protein